MKDALMTTGEMRAFCREPFFELGVIMFDGGVSTPGWRHSLAGEIMYFSKRLAEAGMAPGWYLAVCPTFKAAEAARRLLSGEAAGLQFVEVSHE